MSVFYLDFSGTDERLKEKLLATHPRVLAQLLPAMNAQMLALESYIRGSKLEGQVLHHRTGKLEGSVNVDPSRVEGETVVGSVTQNTAIAPYGPVHEYGGTFTVREHTRRFALSEGGRRIKLLNKSGLVSQRKAIASVGEGIVREHEATYPERSFMRSSKTEKSDEIVEALRVEFVRVLTEEAG